jgi:protein-tyrosine phosphatase
VSVPAGARLPVEGTLNLRDVGGYATTDGRRVRLGRLFRSDHLNTVTDAGFDVLATLGLRTVLDLRLPSERERQPSRLPTGIEVRHVNPLGAAGAAQSEVLEDIKAKRLTRFTEDDVADLYRTMLAEAPEMFSAVVHVAGTPAELPALFHCTAGKDRTGLAAAILLRVLGVSDAVIIEDFELTNTYRSGLRIAQMGPELGALGIDIAHFIPIFTAPRAAMQAALDWLDEHGGVAAYLVDRCGLQSAHLDDARREMLVPVG